MSKTTQDGEAMAVTKVSVRVCAACIIVCGSEKTHLDKVEVTAEEVEGRERGAC